MLGGWSHRALARTRSVWFEKGTPSSGGASISWSTPAHLIDHDCKRQVAAGVPPLDPASKLLGSWDFEHEVSRLAKGYLDHETAQHGSVWGRDVDPLGFLRFLRFLEKKWRT